MNGHRQTQTNTHTHTNTKTKTTADYYKTFAYYITSIAVGTKNVYDILNNCIATTVVGDSYILAYVIEK